MKKLTWLLAAVLLLTAVLFGCSPAEEAAYEDIVITDAEETDSSEDTSSEESSDEDEADSYAEGQKADADAEAETASYEEAAGEETEAGKDASAGSEEDYSYENEDSDTTSEEGFSYEDEDSDTTSEDSFSYEEEDPGEDDKDLGAESYEAAGLTVEEDGSYSSKEEVALYIHTYGKLPSNYITKKQAEKLGWVASKGNLWKVAPGKSIGGSYFGNYEGILPEGDYRECDIDYAGGRRNAKRIVFSTDGHIYYTEDHYESFEQLY